MSNADMDRAIESGSPSWGRRIGTKLWWFFNTPVGMWLLTWGLVGFVVWQYQQWQQEIQQRSERTQKVELLNLEIAARMSQFGTWARQHLVQSSNSKYEFKSEVTKNTVTEAIRGLDDAPGKDNAVGIREMFPENQTRSLLSLYAELNNLVDQQQDHHEIDETTIGPKIALYKFAEQALINPDILFGYHALDHDVFICQFQRIFLTEDISKFGLPSTDCLENNVQGKHECITYARKIECESLRKTLK
jgi:hypothetical protein